MCLGIPGKWSRPIASTTCSWARSIRRRRAERLPGARARGRPDDYVLVHVGFALSRIDEAEAQRVFEFLGKMNQLDELEEPSS